ncbi:hypothetical protein ACFY3O_04015 [Streptomyces sp. NPDC001046]|uniref:hypothetical protein n=1 Tax=unclassified Streptomyces TaxID=2593676 RepID=UPI0035E1CE86
MSHDKDRDSSGEQPGTAFDEVMSEIEDAGTRTRDTEEERRHRGEAGEAVTPNARAQEESEGD